MPNLKPLYLVDPESFFQDFTGEELEEQFTFLKQERARLAVAMKQVESDLYAVKSLIVARNREARGTARLKKRPFKGQIVEQHWAIR